MGTPIANRRRIDLPPIFADESFRLAFPITNEPGESLTFTGKTFELFLNCQSTTKSITNTDPSATVSVDGLTLYISKPATWTTAELAPGTWKYTLYVGTDAVREAYAFGCFNVVARGGA